MGMKKFSDNTSLYEKCNKIELGFVSNIAKGELELEDGSQFTFISDMQKV